LGKPAGATLAKPNKNYCPFWVKAAGSALMNIYGLTEFNVCKVIVKGISNIQVNLDECSLTADYNLNKLA